MSAVREAAYRFYWKLEQWIVPGLRTSQQAYCDALEQFVLPGICWLDMGAGHQIVPAWLGKQETELVRRAGLAAGLDPEFGSIRRHQSLTHRVVATLEHCPLGPATFDLVTANMVMEHLPEPAAAFSEVYRILKPGGVCLFHTPNFKHYLVRIAARVPQWLKNPLIQLLEGRDAKDVYPTQYRVNTSEAIHKLATQAGFQVERLTPVCSSAVTAMLGPLVVPELLITRWLATEKMEDRRSNLIVALRKA